MFILGLIIGTFIGVTIGIGIMSILAICKE